MEELQIADVKLYASGAAVVEGETGAAAVGMIFGSLFVVAVVFAAIYVYYVGPLKNYNFSKRFAYIEILMVNHTVSQQIFQCCLIIFVKKLIDYFILLN